MLNDMVAVTCDTLEPVDIVGEKVVIIEKTSEYILADVSMKLKSVTPPNKGLKYCALCTRHFHVPLISKGLRVCPHCRSTKWIPMLGERIV